MMSPIALRWISLPALILLVFAAGCVERIMRIETSPPGAVVTVNDEEVGLSPVEFSFLWYGDYDIILRKPGYQTLQTNCRVVAPWYQWPPIDLVAEAMVPTMISDRHVLPTFTLEPLPEVGVTTVVERATELRERALFEQPE